MATDDQPTELRRKVLAFYRFVPVEDPQALQQTLLELGERLSIKGTILVAREGVNGTIVAQPDSLDVMARVLTQQLGSIPFKWSDLDENNQGFYRFKVKLKNEIVTLGVEDLDISLTGEHVSPEQWHELMDDPDVVVIDTRNTYEIDIGSFPEAVNPRTTNFREFPQWVAENLSPERNKQIAMFCTGGIRCEKASAYMRQAGFEHVYQLDGGVLRYLEQTEDQDNRWQGECFVFDQRVSVTAELGQGHYQQCYACRHPVSVEDMSSGYYEQGVSCPHCYASDELSDAQRRPGGPINGDGLNPDHALSNATGTAQRRARLRERQRQVELAQRRGEAHIGQRQGSARGKDATVSRKS